MTSHQGPKESAEVKTTRHYSSSSATLSSGSYLKLILKDETGQILVVPEDQDRFVIKVNRLVSACRHEQQRERFEAQFRVLLDQIAKWLKNRDEVDSAYLTLRDGGLAFVAVTKHAEYNEQFDDALSELDLKIASDVDLDLISLNTISLPNVSRDSMSSFLDRSVVLEFPNGN